MNVSTQTTIRLPEERNLDKQIAICRAGAARDRVRVLIERTTKRGTRIPILEITSKGDVLEIPAPALRVGIRERIGHAMQHLPEVLSKRRVTGYTNLSVLVADSDRKVADKRAKNQARRDRQMKRAAQPA